MALDAATAARVRLHPDEARRVFRVLVDALANPGRCYRLPPSAVGRTPIAVVPLLAMTDPDVTIAVEPDRHGWAGVVATATGAPETDLDDAEWVAFLQAPSVTALRRLDPGSVYSPERGTRIVLTAAALATVDERHPAPRSATVVRLAGPGVAGHTDLAVDGIGGEVFAALAATNRGFPAGLDTWLVSDDGSVAAIPRSSSIELR